MGRKTSTIPQAAGVKSSVDAMSQTDPSNPTEPSGLGMMDTDKIMGAIASCQTALMGNIDDLQADVSLLLCNSRSRLSKLERKTLKIETAGIMLGFLASQ